MVVTRWRCRLGAKASRRGAADIFTIGGPGSVLEGVLDLLAGLLEVALSLVGFAAGLQVVVTGDFTGLLFDLASDFLGLVLGLCP